MLIELARPDGTVVCAECRVARSFFARLRGLMAAARLPAGSGLLLPRTRSVHTHFMRFPIDVVFLDADNRIVSITASLRPWRAAASKRARAVLELAANECERLGLREGDVLVEAPR
jgi:uncharacterized membrane protein (UPF0127 family)